MWDENRSSYKFITTQLTWQTSQGMCRDMGGTLVTLDSSAEIAFIAGYLVMHPGENIPYRTKVFIRINVREIRDCQNRERFKPTKNNIQQALDA